MHLFSLHQQFNRSIRDYGWKVLKIKLSNHGMWDHNHMVSVSFVFLNNSSCSITPSIFKSSTSDFHVLLYTKKFHQNHNFDCWTSSHKIRFNNYCTLNLQTIYCILLFRNFLSNLVEFGGTWQQGSATSIFYQDTYCAKINLKVYFHGP